MTMTNTEKEIREILEQEFQPIHLEVVDESHLHAGHMGYREGISTHFRLVIVSENLKDLCPLSSTSWSILKAQLEGDVHALAMKTIKASKWDR